MNSHIGVPCVNSVILLVAARYNIFLVLMGIALMQLDHAKLLPCFGSISDLGLLFSFWAWLVGLHICLLILCFCHDIPSLYFLAVVVFAAICATLAAQLCFSRIVYRASCLRRTQVRALVAQWRQVKHMLLFHACRSAVTALILVAIRVWETSAASFAASPDGSMHAQLLTKMLVLLFTATLGEPRLLAQATGASSSIEVGTVLPHPQAVDSQA